jgi:hypothetical protein
MYVSRCENTNNIIIKEKNQNAQLVEKLFDENKADKKYISLLADVRKWMDATRTVWSNKTCKFERDL